MYYYPISVKREAILSDFMCVSTPYKYLFDLNCRLSHKKHLFCLCPQANEYLPGAKEKMMVYGSEATKLIGEYSEWVMVQSKVWSNLVSKMAADALKSSKATMQDIVE